jgi:methylmalonyl-CoA mutase N-terminal domain/subunit
VAEEMIRRVKKLREERDHRQVEQELSKLRSAAEGRENLMPFVINAVKAYATMGEICDVFRNVFGEYKGPVF